MENPVGQTSQMGKSQEIDSRLKIVTRKQMASVQV